jgi:ABC-type spermidine/putrescine transport system permease subunit I
MKKKRTKFRPGALWTTPSVILLLCLTILPLLMLLVFSFMNRNIFAGQPWPGWTLRNITRMFGSATFWRLMGKSLLRARSRSSASLRRTLRRGRSQRS